MTWELDAEQPRPWGTDFAGDTVVPGDESIAGYTELRALNIGAPGANIYLFPGVIYNNTLIASAIGETYDVGQSQFSNSFDNGAVALVNSVLADGGDGVPYTPGSAEDWDTEVTTVGEALDVLANRVRQLEL